MSGDSDEWAFSRFDKAGLPTPNRLAASVTDIPAGITCFFMKIPGWTGFPGFCGIMSALEMNNNNYCIPLRYRIQSNLRCSFVSTMMTSRVKESLGRFGVKSTEFGRQRMESQGKRTREVSAWIHVRALSS